MLWLLAKDPQRAWTIKELSETVPGAKRASLRSMVSILKKQGRVQAAGYAAIKHAPPGKLAKPTGLASIRKHRVQPSERKALAADKEANRSASYLRQQVERSAIACMIDLGLDDDDLPRLKRWLGVAFDRGRESINGVTTPMSHPASSSHRSSGRVLSSVPPA